MVDRRAVSCLFASAFIESGRKKIRQAIRFVLFPLFPVSISGLMLDLNMKHVFSLSLTELHVLIFNKSGSDNEENWAEKAMRINLSFISVVKGICCANYVSCPHWTNMFPAYMMLQEPRNQTISNGS